MSNDSSKHPADQPEHPASSKAVPWHPWWTVLFVAIIFFAAQIIGGLAVSFYPWTQHWTTIQASDWLQSSVNGQFTFYVIAEGLTLGAVYLFLRRYPTGFSKIGLRRPRWSDLGYGFAAVPPYFILYILTVIIIAAVAPGLDVNQKQEIGFDHVTQVLPLLMAFVSLVILPAFTEEIVVRGLLYSSLKKALPLGWAVVATSALFAAAHLPEGGPAGPLYIAAIDTFVLSLVLIYLREKTGGLWASMTLHALKNSIAYIALFIAPLIHIHMY